MLDIYVAELRREEKKAAAQSIYHTWPIHTERACLPSFSMCYRRSGYFLTAMAYLHLSREILPGITLIVVFSKTAKYTFTRNGYFCYSFIMTRVLRYFFSCSSMAAECPQHYSLFPFWEMKSKRRYNGNGDSRGKNNSLYTLSGARAPYASSCREMPVRVQCAVDFESNNARSNLLLLPPRKLETRWNDIKPDV